MKKIKNLKTIIDNSKYTVFFGGAGVSTESGIPDFRSEEGLYKAEEIYNHSPEEILSIDFFTSHMDIFYKYHKENIIHQEANPNWAHKGLAQLEKMNKLKAIITQNIDGLHQKAGSKNVLELHGTVYKNYCMVCGEKYGLDYIMKSKTDVPKCKKCGGNIRPDVVLYGEGLDTDVIEKAVNHILNADTLIVGGSSLVVHPAAGLIRYFKGDNLVLINKTPTNFDSSANLTIRELIGETFKKLMDLYSE
ncbi:MAG: NAD-dependent protein deacylase [Bacillota bacterium]|nr:NAD-dependent protein deacylase [Bacillota bacterium]